MTTAEQRSQPMAMAIMRLARRASDSELAHPHASVGDCRCDATYDALYAAVVQVCADCMRAEAQLGTASAALTEVRDRLSRWAKYETALGIHADQMTRLHEYVSGVCNRLAGVPA